jgi:hypothetical protein
MNSSRSNTFGSTSAASSSSSTPTPFTPLLRIPLAASSIEHSIECNFMDAAEVNLVTAGANVLRVFRMRPQKRDGINEKKGKRSNAAPWSERCLLKPYFSSVLRRRGDPSSQDAPGVRCFLVPLRPDPVAVQGSPVPVGREGRPLAILPRRKGQRCRVRSRGARFKDGLATRLRGERNLKMIKYLENVSIILI